MDLDQYRQNPRQQARVEDLLSHVEKQCSSILDVGARDGFISELLAQNAQRVVALDLELPKVTAKNIEPCIGDVTNLEFEDRSFETVVCAEVIEHIPPEKLQEACDELSRVVSHRLVIGVPFAQDVRLGRTTCASCGAVNPPWGHFNSFDEKRLVTLFKGLKPVKITYVGRRVRRTNFLSAALMNAAGNPWGEYSQEESCVFCGAAIEAPKNISFTQSVLAGLARGLNRLQKPFLRPKANWIHISFEKPD